MEILVRTDELRKPLYLYIYKFEQISWIIRGFIREEILEWHHYYHSLGHGFVISFHFKWFCPIEVTAMIDMIYMCAV